MFICDPCLSKRPGLYPSIFRSCGPCEDCGTTATCSDVPTWILARHPSRRAPSPKDPR
jgi:hypothetical protein